MKSAMITGINGQDGAYLARLLLEKGYHVFGAQRQNSDVDHWRTDRLGITKEIEYLKFDLAELANIQRVINKTHPDEIYNLGAQTSVQLAFEQPLYSSDVNFMGVNRILESTRNTKIKFFQASTKDMYGNVREIPQTENTPFYPCSPYAAAKAGAHWMTVNYREAYGMFCCNGILFNHESPLRGEEFVTRKIVKCLVEVCQKKRDCIELGNIEAQRDWGHASDFVNAMYLMMQHSTADDYVIATGKTHSIKDLINKVCGKLNLDPERVVKINPELFRPAEVDTSLGDPSKAINVLGWKPKYSFDELIDEMVSEEIKYS